MIVLVPAFLLVDFLVRSPQSDHYVRDTVAYRRPANASFEVVFDDKPVAARSFPSAIQRPDHVTDP